MIDFLARLRHGILAAACLLSSASSLVAQATTKPNILFILTDDQRADTIAALGNKNIKTPNIDALVKRGTTFTRAYCMGGARHGAVCVPSRAMILTGRSLFHVNESIAGQTSWPEMFALAGYTTFATGKWHNGLASLRQCFAHAADIMLGGMADNPYAVSLIRLDDNRKSGPPEKDAKHSVDRFTDSAVAFLKKQKAGQPFLAYVAFNLPHDPRIAPKKYRDRFADNFPPVPPNFLPVHPFNNGEMVVRDEKLAPWPRTPEVVRSALADYYACIEFIDDEVGRLVAALKEAGVYDNTIIVFTSDHGLAIGSHGLFGKQNLYDHSMRAPLIISGPGIPADRTNDSLAYLYDIFPTLGDLAGVTGPAGSEGISLAPAMRGDVKNARPALFTAYRQLQRAVRDDRWHLIVYPPINRTQLFDLRNDPHELTDLAGVAANAGEVQRLTALLRECQTKAGDNLPLSVAQPAAEKFDIPKDNSSKKGKAKGAP